MSAGRAVWVLGEQRNGSIHPVSYELLAWGRTLADDLGVGLECILVGHGVAEEANQLIMRGADRVYCLDHRGLETFRVDPYARLIEMLVREHEPDILLAAATTMGRTLMPVLAAKLHTGLTADCTGLSIALEERLLLQTRPAIGGNVLATIKTPSHRPQMATVHPKSRRPLPADPSRSGDIEVVEIDQALLASRVSRLHFEPDLTMGSSIQDAELIVAGGRGLRTAKRFADLFEIAKLLRGVVGASRCAVDQGWASYAHQVGLSGKSVSPTTYIALGISGSPNHLAGMSSAELVIAVNSDPDAPIFQVADVGIVADLAEFLPAWLDRLRKQAGENEGAR
ncbi:MAG: electron transfer flavoprotein subunit alpha/FixB family protein [Candidatus Atribacteria bacterium]|nr:MAG: electron transfer flavoprotein subunit alpha/FixB family protein [Candidatus Atribacteria bacterium]